MVDFTLSKANLVALADAYVEAKNALSEWEVRVADLREQILDTGYNAIPGTRCKITVEHKTTKRLSSDLVLEQLGEERFEACKRSSSIKIVRVKPD